MTNFKVSWCVDIEGVTNAKQAALRVAEAYFQDRIANGETDSACVFEVTNEKGETVTIDLAENENA